jgi:hypothetical protein
VSVSQLTMRVPLTIAGNQESTPRIVKSPPEEYKRAVETDPVPQSVIVLPSNSE